MQVFHWEFLLLIPPIALIMIKIYSIMLFTLVWCSATFRRIKRLRDTDWTILLTKNSSICPQTQFEIYSEEHKYGCPVKRRDLFLSDSCEAQGFCLPFECWTRGYHEQRFPECCRIIVWFSCRFPYMTLFLILFWFYSQAEIHLICIHCLYIDRNAIHPSWMFEHYV